MSKNTNFMCMIPHYEKSIKDLKKKVIAYAAMGNDAKVAQLNKDIRDTERQIRDIKSDSVKKLSTGVDKYLN